LNVRLPPLYIVPKPGARTRSYKTGFLKHLFDNHEVPLVLSPLVRSKESDLLGAQGFRVNTHSTLLPSSNSLSSPLPDPTPSLTPPPLTFTPKPPPLLTTPPLSPYHSSPSPPTPPTSPPPNAPGVPPKIIPFVWVIVFSGQTPGVVERTPPQPFLLRERPRVTLTSVPYFIFLCFHYDRLFSPTRHRPFKSGQNLSSLEPRLINFSVFVPPTPKALRLCNQALCPLMSPLINSTRSPCFPKNQIRLPRPKKNRPHG